MDDEAAEAGDRHRVDRMEEADHGNLEAEPRQEHLEDQQSEQDQRVLDLVPGDQAPR